MNEADVLEVAREGVIVMIQVSAPIMLLGLVVGLIISLFQALTQIQEATLSFVPKIILVFIALLVLFPFMLRSMVTFMERIADRIISLG